MKTVVSYSYLELRYTIDIFIYPMLKSQNKQSIQLSSKWKRLIDIDWNYVVLILACAVFIFNCFQIDLTQDDAYISFRYAANYLNGEGLVYNHGERVEGYTNFFWIMLLVIFKGVFGIDYLLTSRIIGVISGTTIFLLLYLLLKQHFKKVPLILHISLVVAMLSNLSLPYWSVASLETSAFACMALAAVIADHRRPQLAPALLVIATLLRPEGAVVFGVILINRVITRRKLVWDYIVIYLVLLLPFAVFKFVYYGSLLPNSYYAKSGVGLEYIQSGLEYFWHFTKTIGVYGIVFLIPLLTIKRLWNECSLLYLYVLLSCAYIVWVGGDVLKVYRFFVPVVPVLYFLFVVSLVELISLVKFNLQRVYGIVSLCVIAFSFASYSLSHELIWACREAERRLITNMHFVSTSLKKYMGSDFSLSASAIGMVGYQLLGHRIIDMLGLTDSYIAHNPEKTEGMISTWKEHRFNNHYLLKQQPDFILFSTGYKPSAPAEQALMLHSEFRHGYSTVCFLFNRVTTVVWRRKRQLDTSRDIVSPDIDFVYKLNDGCNRLRTEPKMALVEFREARQRLGEDFTLFSYMTGECFLHMNKLDSAAVYFRQALMLDTLCSEARIMLIQIAYNTGDTVAMINQESYLKKFSPWLFDSNQSEP